jgi:hypothetical protein
MSGGCCPHRAARSLESIVKTGLHRIGETTHLAALGVWTGALVGAGITAAVTFPTVRDLQPTLATYSGYGGDHWMLLAGRVASRVFLVTDVVQFVCSLLAVVGFALAVVAGGYLAPQRRSVVLFLRALCLGLAFVSVSYHLLILMPSMQHDLRQYWDAAALGDTETAERFRQAFADRHPDASRSMGLTALAAFATMVLGAWHLTAPRDRTP